MTHVWLGVAFAATVLALLALDLGVAADRSRAPTLRHAAAWSAVPIAAAAAFAVAIRATLGTREALQFATGYLVEEALSVDNLFVFAVIFAYFRVPAALQRRVLFWGIFGALMLRGVMVGAGALLLREFAWLAYVFGAFLLLTGARLATRRASVFDAGASPVLKLVRRVVPVTHDFRGARFFVRERTPAGALRVAVTPLFVVLVLVETTDVLFAVDSIPAVFGVTRDAFLIYTSNVFAIVALRSVYAVLAHAIGRFHLLRYGVAAVLVFVGATMLSDSVWRPPTLLSLGFVVFALAASVVASVLRPRHAAAPTS